VTIDYLLLMVQFFVSNTV